MATEAHELRMVVLADFTGGINTSVSPQLLQDNEFQVLKNFEYDANRLVTRGGLSEALAEYDNDIKAVFYDDSTRCYLVCLENGTVYEENLVDLHHLVGTLTGNEKPSFCRFDGKIFVASGGLLQYYDYVNHALTTIEASYLCDNVFERFGRLVVSHKGDDNLYYSATGDAYETGWEEDTNDDSSAKWIEIGYKDDGDILKVLPIGGDIAIFKTNGRVYTLSGEYPNWNVTLVGDNSDVYNAEAISVLGSTIAFVSNSGLRTLETVATYGNFTINEIGRRFNRTLATNLFEPRLYNIVRKRQLIICPNTSESNKLFCFQYDLGAAIEFEFALPINDMVDTQDDVIIASGNSLYRWSREHETDNGTAIVQELKTKEYTSSRQIYSRFFDIGVNGTIGGLLRLEWAGKPVNYIVKRPRRVINGFTVCRQTDFKLKATKKIDIEYIKVAYFEK